MLKLVECVFDVVGHGEVDFLEIVVPFKGETKEFSTGRIRSNDLLVPECVK